MELIQAKTILSYVKQDTFFGLSYNMNLYRGCQHGCIYCDSRSSCYQMDELHKIYVKENALELLGDELPRKQRRGTVGTGSMNDPYMPLEKKMKMTRGALKLLVEHRFPVHVMTKSDLVLRDLDLLLELKNTYAAVSFSITTTDDALASKIEPNAPLPSARFEAISKLRRAGIYTGITMMPILPYIGDTQKNVDEMVALAKQADAQYILPYFGVTLRDGSRDYFYEELDKSFPGIKDKYVQQYGDTYGCNSPNAKALYARFYERCHLHQIPTKMDFYQIQKPQQLKLF